MLRQDFSRQPRPILSHRLGTFIGGDWQVSARTIRIGACALIYDSPQFGLCIANGDEMALAAFILSGSARQAPALHKILNTALRIMVMNARDPDNAFPQVLSYCARALPRVELTAREAARLTELNQLIQREASAQTRARAMARWSAEDRLFADSESGKTQERDDHGRYNKRAEPAKHRISKKPPNGSTTMRLRNMESINAWSMFKRRSKGKVLMSVILGQRRTPARHSKKPISSKFPMTEITRSAMW
jgi:hypothetical protein